ncbi:hypothetical protein WICPIJ_000413 [Wickerhamomyces pijperi]|uniref:Uncharacterized protein n=1 Tax=Wickerhamomyces pijperi TaxID=599730 RepID=A0A9P8QDP5_WICPI|nr:hypothetical protein WICPIJ_000413 [Wickerhamomyces pijperi]
MDQRSTLRTFHHRVADIERQINLSADPDDQPVTIKQSIDLLCSHFNKFLDSQPTLAKFFQNLKKYHIKPDPTPSVLLDIDIKREYLLAKLAELKNAVKLLDQIDALKDFKTVADLDLSGVDVHRITELQLRYNFLMMKSIEVFTNYLRVLEKVKIRYGLLNKGLEIDVPEESDLSDGNS